MTAKEIQGNYEKIPEGQERVIYDINVDLDFTNDTGTFIPLISDVVGEDKWLLAPGGEYEIGEIKHELMNDLS